MATGDDEGLQPGEVWTFQGAPDGARVIIGLVEPIAPGGQKVAHVALANLPAPAPAPEGVSITVPHLPVALEAVEQSLVAKEGVSAPPDAFLDGYQRWKLAATGGTASVLEISLSEACAMVYEAAARADED